MKIAPVADAWDYWCRIVRMDSLLNLLGLIVSFFIQLVTLVLNFFISLFELILHFI